MLFFTRGKTERNNTQAVWVYDLRTNMNSFGKPRQLTREDFAEFETAFGDDPYGQSSRMDQGEEGRWRCLSRQQIADRQDNLDLSWLRDTGNDPEDNLTEPEADDIVVIQGGDRGESPLQYEKHGEHYNS